MGTHIQGHGDQHCVEQACLGSGWLEFLLQQLQGPVFVLLCFVGAISGETIDMAV